MFRTIAIVAVACAALSAAALAQTVTVSLTSSQNGQTVTPGSTVNWQISFIVSAGDNQGLALLSADLIQNAANPVRFNIPPASGVPAAMTNFSRPAGICNPGEIDPTTGYIGVQRGTTGQKNLLQIGGAQNTFGMATAPGSGVAENASATAGVGQAGSVVLASGSFAAPSTLGSYSYNLANVTANTLIQRNNPPAFSPVAQATAVVAPSSFSFTVGYPSGDMNCDGTVNNFDIDPFVIALTDPASYATLYAGCNILNGDINHDGGVNNFDIDPFVLLLTGGP